jgi:hypothetical protein
MYCSALKCSVRSWSPSVCIPVACPCSSQPSLLRRNSYALTSSRIISIGSEEGGINIHRYLLREYPNASVRDGLCDCYLFSYDLLADMKGRLEGLKGLKRDLVPKLVKHQMNSAFLRKLGREKPLVLTYFLAPEIYFATRANNLRSYMDLTLKCCYPFGGKNPRGRPVPLPPIVLRRTRNNSETSSTTTCVHGPSRLPSSSSR